MIELFLLFFAFLIVVGLTGEFLAERLVSWTRKRVGF